jgi:hypothetical protein
MVTNKTYAIYWKPAGFSCTGHDHQPVLHRRRARQRPGVERLRLGHAVPRSGNEQDHLQLDVRRVHDRHESVSGQRLPLYSGSRCASPIAQLQTEINNVIASQGWVKNGTNMFFLFTAKSVGGRFDARRHVRVHGVLCLPRHGELGRDLREPALHGGTSGCDEGQYPNGSSNQADPTINVTSHEHNEAITDPS